MPQDFRWSPIADLPSDWSTLTDGELRALTEVWLEQREELADSESLRTFQTQLHRRWAIETGVIEGAYTLDRGVTETLIREGIDANLIRSNATNQDPNTVAVMIDDHLQVLEGLFEFVNGGRELTTSYIKELHAALLAHVRTHTVRDAQGNLFETELIKGEYKKLANNPSRSDGSTHEYCPPEHVTSEMDNLVRLHQEHQRQSVPPEIQAAWLHHRFTQIHPFADGNGRVARAIASAVLIKAGLFPVLITRDDRDYIPVLELADAGELIPLVKLLISGQRRAVVDAIHAIPPVPERMRLELGAKQPKSVEEQIDAARLKLVVDGRLSLANPNWKSAQRIGAKLASLAGKRFSEVAARLQATIGAPQWRFSSGTSDHYVTPSTFKEINPPLEYEPEWDWQRCSFIKFSGPGSDSEIVLSLHSIGPHFRGMIAGEILYRSAGRTRRTNDESLQVNYKEADVPRFSRWLEDALSRGLALWREEL